jgi:HEPN domain-containing protein
MVDKPKHYVLEAKTGQYALSGSPLRGIIVGAAISRLRRIRESIGHTFERQKSNPEAWYSLAKSFHEAAKLLNESPVVFPSDTRPFALNAALSLELLFKAVLTKRGIQHPTSKSGHDLKSLSIAAKLDLSENRLITLEMMTEELILASRYPSPKKEEQWNDFHDRIVEKAIVRTQIGSLFRSDANPLTFPNWENYLSIWEIGRIEMDVIG